MLHMDQDSDKKGCRRVRVLTYPNSNSLEKNTADSNAFETAYRVLMRLNAFIGEKNAS